MLADEMSGVESAEKELSEEGHKITILQESLQQTLQICNDMIKKLDLFESHVSALESTIMPLHRNLTIISRVHNNVEGTLNIVKLLSEKNELAKREEFILAGGPTMENLEAYLTSIDRVQGSIQALNDADLGFCRVTIRRLETIGGVGMDSLTSKYKEWLSEESIVRDPNQTGNVGTSTADLLSPEVAEKLRRIANFAAEKETIMVDVLSYYGEVRSNYMMQTLQSLFRNIDSGVKGGYQRGSHPFIIAVREFFKLAQKEAIFATQVLPPSVVPDAIRRAIKHPADLVKMSAEAVGAKVSKSAARHEFVDQIWILDVIEAFNDMYVACPSLSIQETIRPALKSVTTGGVDFMRELMDDMQGTSRTTTTLTASANATVFEQTSSLLNCLKRMLEYERIIEALLNRWSQQNWDGIVGPITVDSTVFAMALYYQDLLKGLEVAIEKYSHGYRRPITSVLFQLNNYNYILRTFKTSNLASMVTIEAEQKYESIVEALVNEYLSSWYRMIALIEDGTQRSASLSPRDRLKIFASELEQIVQSQEGCAIPDTELRISLVAKIRELVMTPFIAFYNMNQQLFAASYSKIKLDPDIVETMLNRMFQA